MPKPQYARRVERDRLALERSDQQLADYHHLRGFIPMEAFADGRPFYRSHHTSGKIGYTLEEIRHFKLVSLVEQSEIEIPDRYDNLFYMSNLIQEKRIPCFRIRDASKRSIKLDIVPIPKLNFLYWAP
tara:strand:- start:6821 stop:7204 length:384 start_codon:yes stop_codon:yes gene_type:complete